MEPTEGTVLVIRPIHNAQAMAYEYKTVEVPEEIAQDQLSKPDAERNYTWRKVRYANDEEKAAYYNKPIEKEIKRGRPVKAE